MKVIIPAAGYATRLYPLTKERPKHLLEVEGKPILNHVLDKLACLEEVSEVIIITNNKFYQAFKEWSGSHSYAKPIMILNDNTLNNEDRLGTIGDLKFAFEINNINEDCLVILGDNLFGFSLKDFLDAFKENNATTVAFYDLKDYELAKKFGIGHLKGNRVTSFLEKPENPPSTLVSTGCYLIKKKDLYLLDKLLAEGIKDCMGDFIKCIVENSQVYGFIFDEYWFDIGSFEMLEKAREYYRNEN